MKISRLEFDADRKELKINGETVDFPIEVDVYDGTYPKRMILNGNPLKFGNYLPVLLIEASSLTPWAEQAARDAFVESARVKHNEPEHITAPNAVFLPEQDNVPCAIWSPDDVILPQVLIQPERGQDITDSGFGINFTGSFKLFEADSVSEEGIAVHTGKPPSLLLGRGNALCKKYITRRGKKASTRSDRKKVRK